MNKDCKINNTMDGDCEKQDSDPLSNVRNLFQSIRLRCPFKVDDRSNRWLLEWNFGFLPIISIVLYIILCII